MLLLVMSATSTKSHSFFREWGSWQVELRFSLIAGRWELRGLQIEPVPSDPLADEVETPQPLPSTLVRKLPVARFVAEWRAYQRRVNKEAVDYGAVWVTQYGKRLADEQALAVLNRGIGVGESARAGRPTFWTHAKLAKVARVYAAAWTAGSRAPTAAVAMRFHVSRSMAAKLVTMARSDGLLPPTSPGHGGWEARAT